MSPTENYAEKIAALLRKAEDPAATPEEAESYSAKAEQLMVKWGISDALLDAKRRGQRKAAEKVVEQKIKVTGSFCRGEIMLGFAAGHGLGTVRVLKANGRGSTMEQWLYFIGFESDVARAVTLFESLRLQASSARRAWYKNWAEKSDRTNNERYLAQRQFIISFADVVEQRLTAMRTTETEAVEPGTALVLVDRSAKVDEWLGEKYPKLGNARGVNRSWDGRSEGRAAGAKANLGGTQVGTGSSGSIEA